MPRSTSCKVNTSNARTKYRDLARAHLGGHHDQAALLLPHHLPEVRPGGAHAALGRDVLLEGLPRHQVLVRLVVDVVGVDVVRARLVRVAVAEDDPRVVKRENVLVAVLGLVLRPLPLLAAVQVLLQRLELLPEARLAASEAARAALPQQLRDINIASP